MGCVRVCMSDKQGSSVFQDAGVQVSFWHSRLEVHMNHRCNLYASGQL